MSRIKNKLTARTVETIKVPGYYSDGGNLYLCVTKSLTKSWAFYYVKNGKRTEKQVGKILNIFSSGKIHWRNIAMLLHKNVVALEKSA